MQSSFAPWSNAAARSGLDRPSLDDKPVGNGNGSWRPAGLGAGMTDSDSELGSMITNRATWALSGVAFLVSLINSSSYLLNIRDAF